MERIVGCCRLEPLPNFRQKKFIPVVGPRGADSDSIVHHLFLKKCPETKPAAIYLGKASFAKKARRIDLLQSVLRNMAEGAELRA